MRSVGFWQDDNIPEESASCGMPCKRTFIGSQTGESNPLLPSHSKSEAFWDMLILAAAFPCYSMQHLLEMEAAT